MFGVWACVVKGPRGDVRPCVCGRFERLEGSRFLGFPLTIFWGQGVQIVEHGDWRAVR